MIDDKFKSVNSAPVRPEEVSDSREEAERKYLDEAALKILAHDFEVADADAAIKNFTNEFTVAEILYKSPSNSTAYYNPTRANVPRFTLSNIVDVVVPKVHGAVFFDTPAFMLRPDPSLDQKILWAKEAIAQAQLRDMEFETECYKGFEQCALQGTMVFKYGWERRTEKVVRYKRKGQPAQINTLQGSKSLDTVESDTFEKITEDVQIDRPWFKWKNVAHVMPDTSLQEGDISKAAWVVDREYFTFDDIENLRDQDGYDIPSVDELKDLFFAPKAVTPEGGNVVETGPVQMRAWLDHAEGRNVNTSADPFENKIEVLERWDANKVITALHRSGRYLLIRNTTHEFGEVPYRSSNWRNEPGSFYGQGLGKLIGPDQRVEQGTTNAYLNILAFIANPTYARQKSINTPSQNERLELGAIISVEGPVKDAFGMIEQPRIDQALVAAIGSAQASAASTSGANEIAGQGKSLGAGSVTGMRSGSGAQLVGQANASRLDGVIEKFIRQVFIPWLYKMDELNNEFLPSSAIRDILGEDAAHDYEGLNHEELRNAKVKYEILAGAQLGPKNKMAATLPFIEQLISTPAMMTALQSQNVKFDALAFVDFMCNLAGFRYKQPFFVPMSPEEIQQAQAQSQAAMQAQKQQGAVQMQQLKGDQKLQEIDNQQLGKAANEALRQTLAKKMTPELKESV